MKPSMVGAQNAIKIASSFFPLIKSVSETIMMENTTKSITKFIAPIRLIKFFNILRTKILIKYT